MFAFCQGALKGLLVVQGGGVEHLDEATTVAAVVLSGEPGTVSAVTVGSCTTSSGTGSCGRSAWAAQGRGGGRQQPVTAGWKIYGSLLNASKGHLYYFIFVVYNAHVHHRHSRWANMGFGVWSWVPTRKTGRGIKTFWHT